MWKLSVLSLLTFVLLLVAYFLGGINPKAINIFNGMLGYYGITFLISTILMGRDLRRKHD